MRSSPKSGSVGSGAQEGPEFRAAVRGEQVPERLTVGWVLLGHNARERGDVPGVPVDQ
jgi:hypothetical protein